MVEMLPLISIAPEMNLTHNPATGIIGAALPEAVIVSMDEINNQITELEMTAEDLYHALDPTTTSLDAYPGREGVYLTAGKITNMVYGFIIGLVVMIALLII